ncbi:unnamed protein product [Meloidogyne enterolobii]|uniref:Uncharacterized protein n=1 Tax=Meloidogyne enterolobii TaxID=390850 RepID=A0ACB0ZFS1_MELEN
MIFLKQPNSFFKKRMIFFLIFCLICIEYAIGMQGEGSSKGTQKHHGNEGAGSFGIVQKLLKFGGAGSSKGTGKHLGDEGAGTSGGGSQQVEQPVWGQFHGLDLDNAKQYKIKIYAKQCNLYTYT